MTVVPLLVETFGGCAPPLMSALQRAADWRQNKLTSSEYDETTWSARTWLSFVSQRLSVATQLAAAQEVAEALGQGLAARRDGAEAAHCCCRGRPAPSAPDSRSKSRTAGT